ncbi:MAG: type II toxin-antitoxin system RelE/ParE family toxin [Steroidobacteraceae bacterium]
MTPEFHPAARDELAAAIKIGELRATRLGAELLFETQRVVALLCDMPDVGEPFDRRYRRFPLRRFPFSLVYRVDGLRLRIVAFAHRRALREQCAIQAQAVIQPIYDAKPRLAVRFDTAYAGRSNLICAPATSCANRCGIRTM